MKHKYLNISSIKGVLREIKVVVLLTLVLIILLSMWAIFKLPIEHSLATMVLDFGTEKRVFEGEASGMTILDTLIASAEAGNITFGYGYNENREVQITLLNGHSSYDPLVEFMFFINSKPINTSEIDKLSVKPGDTIRMEVKRHEADK